MKKLSVSDRKTIASFCMGVSFMCVLFAVLSAAFVDLWLASTQWVLLGVFLAVWGVYLKLELNA